MMIVCVTGTGPPFPRLVDALATYARANPTTTVWLQHGTTQLPPGLLGRPFIPRSELLEVMQKASVVVCHGGSGSISDALMVGHVPVVVPRYACFREIQSDHQLDLTNHLASQSRVIALLDLRDLDNAVERACARRSVGINAVSERGLLNALREDAEHSATQKPNRPVLQRLLRMIAKIGPEVPLRGTMPTGEANVRNCGNHLT